MHVSRIRSARSRQTELELQVCLNTALPAAPLRTRSQHAKLRAARVG
jgi:hypothetical protein